MRIILQFLRWLSLLRLSVDAYSVLKNTRLQTCLFFVYFVQHFSLMWHRHTYRLFNSVDATLVCGHWKESCWAIAANTFMFIGYKVVLICVYVNKSLNSVTIQTKVLDHVLDSVVWSLLLYKSAFKELSVFAFSKNKSCCQNNTRSS